MTGTTYGQDWPFVTLSVGHTGKISRSTIAELVHNICDGTSCGSKGTSNFPVAVERAFYWRLKQQCPTGGETGRTSCGRALYWGNGYSRAQEGIQEAMSLQEDV